MTLQAFTALEKSFFGYEPLNFVGNMVNYSAFSLHMAYLLVAQHLNHPFPFFIGVCNLAPKMSASGVVKL